MHRRPPSTRLGAFALTLLLQVFVGSSLLHPCCLASDVDGGHASAPVPTADLGHGAHGGEGGLHHAPDHASTAGHGGLVAHDSGHAGHGGHDDADGSGCEGLCGFCCQTAGLEAIPATPASIDAVDHAPVPASRPLRVAIRGSDTAHLVPWANAPPAPRSTFV
jgi:hypothetical protein